MGYNLGTEEPQRNYKLHFVSSNTGIVTLKFLHYVYVYTLLYACATYFRIEKTDYVKAVGKQEYQHNKHTKIKAKRWSLKPFKFELEIAV